MGFTIEDQKVYDEALAELRSSKGTKGPDVTRLKEVNCGSEIKISQMGDVMADDLRISRFAKKAEGLFNRG